ncbi:hypothetical protein HK103_005922 [Boothiomyces macroporosus]|uniref:HMG box domain-containing protein n=1 Tax=Boothiomyces macroporosus TaxID=261099 RepID=A0AAD5YAR1_9FUNG|nr:hypothetical protein HK103_005922 [Boothiomyces macroporosus]
MTITAWTIYKKVNSDKLKTENPGLSKLNINRMLSQNYKKLSPSEKRQLLIDYQDVKTEPVEESIKEPIFPQTPPLPHLMCCQSYFPHFNQYCNFQPPYQFPLELYDAPLNVNHQPTIDLQSTDMLIKVDTSVFKNRSQSFNEQYLNKKIEGYQVLSPRLFGIEYVDTQLQASKLVEPASNTEILNPTPNNTVGSAPKKRKRKPKDKVQKSKEPAVKLEQPDIPPKVGRKKKMLVKVAIPQLSNTEVETNQNVNSAIPEVNPQKLTANCNQIIDQSDIQDTKSITNSNDLPAANAIGEANVLTSSIIQGKYNIIIDAQAVPENNNGSRESNELLNDPLESPLMQTLDPIEVLLEPIPLQMINPPSPQDITVPSITIQEPNDPPVQQPQETQTKKFPKSPSAIFDQFLEQTLFDSVVP